MRPSRSSRRWLERWNQGARFRRRNANARAEIARPAVVRSPTPTGVALHPAQPPRLDSEGGADAGVAIESAVAPAFVIARSSCGAGFGGAGCGGAVAIAHSGHASRTRLVASSAFVRPAAQRSPGSSAQILSAARRIDASARHATMQSEVERAWASDARVFSSVVRSSLGLDTCASAGADEERRRPRRSPESRGRRERSTPGASQVFRYADTVGGK